VEDSGSESSIFVEIENPYKRWQTKNTMIGPKDRTISKALDEN
jgi:hypothetical protein